MHGMTADAPPAPTPAAPNWDAISQDVHCPLCEYNLRGLTNQRCPECGYAFRWRELLDPTQRRHPYLFEHHPECKIRAFVRTAIGGWRPARFWKTMNPVQPSHPGRLLLYWLIAVFIYAAIAEAASGVLGYVYALRYGLFPIKNLVLQFMFHPGTLIMLSVPIIYTWLVFLSLQIFQISMRRVRVRPIHVLRCVLYSYDIVTVVGLLAALAVGVLLFSPVFRGNEDWVLGLFLFFIAVGMYRMWMAYRYYLRFEHAFLTVFFAHIIALLSLPIAMIPLAMFGR